MKKLLLLLLLCSIPSFPITAPIKIKVEIIEENRLEKVSKFNSFNIYYYDYENRTNSDIKILSFGEYKSFPKAKLVKANSKQKFIFLASNSNKVALYKNINGNLYKKLEMKKENN